MSPKAFLAMAVVAIAILGCGESSRPRVVLILADDLGWGDVGVHGGAIPTPAIDRLAREGVELNRFYVSPLCSPTRAAMLTGRSAEDLGMLHSVVRPWSSQGLPAGVRSLGDVFRAGGYRTGLVGKWHLGHTSPEHHPNRRGFDYFYGSLNGAVDYLDHSRAGSVDWQRNGETLIESGYTPDLVAAEAEQFIARHAADPFFLVVAFHAVHGPPQAPEDRIAAAGSFTRDPVFAAMLTSLDDGVARISRAIDDAGLSDRTLVVFTSDNGAGQSGGTNRPLRGGKGTPFEGGIRVPAFLRWPGQLVAGSRSEQRSRDVDLFPTLASAAGIRLDDAEREVDGVDLWPELSSGSVQPREPFFFASVSGGGRYAAVVEDRFKLVIDESANRRERRYLFDLEDDPRERRDVSSRHGAELLRLTELLDTWRRQHAASDVLEPSGAPESFSAPSDWAAASKPS